MGDGSSGSGGRAKGGPREGERRLGAGAGWVEVVAGGAEELSAGVPDSSGECGGGERAKRWPRGDGSHARRASALDLSTVPRARRALEHRLARPALVDDDGSPPLVLRSTLQYIASPRPHDQALLSLPGLTDLARSRPRRLNFSSPLVHPTPDARDGYPGRPCGAEAARPAERAKLQLVDATASPRSHLLASLIQTEGEARRKVAQKKVPIGRREKGKKGEAGLGRFNLGSRNRRARGSPIRLRRTAPAAPAFARRLAPSSHEQLERTHSCARLLASSSCAFFSSASAASFAACDLARAAMARFLTCSGVRGEGGREDGRGRGSSVSSCALESSRGKEGRAHLDVDDTADRLADELQASERERQRDVRRAQRA